MRFDANTKVADAVTADPSLIDRLAALSPVFERLRNEDDRRLLGGLVTLSEAAAIAGVPLDDLLHAANARSPAACVSRYRDAPDEVPPDWMAGFRDSDAVRVDVRPLIAEDREPFTTVMTAAAALAVGGQMVLDAPFNPLPLRRILGGKGLASFARRLADDHWRIYCLRRDTAQDLDVPLESAHGARVWRAADGVHIDVRHLEAPAPLVAILALVDGPDHGGRIVVHHRRDPLYLYPELQERGWSWSRLEGEPGEVRLLLVETGGTAPFGS